MAEQLIDSLGHFAGGLVGEGDCEDRVGRDVLFLDEPGDAMCDDAGFAGAGAGKDEQGTLRGLDGRTLLGIEMGEKGMQECVLWGQGPESSVSFGRRAVNEAGFKAPKRLSRSRRGARQERGRRVHRREMRPKQLEETVDTGEMFWGLLPGVITGSSEDG